MINLPEHKIDVSILHSVYEKENSISIDEHISYEFPISVCTHK